MDSAAQLDYLIDLAEGLGMTLRHVAGRGTSDAAAGDVVRLKGREILFLDSAAPVTEQIAAVAQALRGRPELDEMYLPPQVRDTLGA